MVKSVFPESSTISSVSPESDVLIFSFSKKFPITLVRTTFVPPVPSEKTKPFAPLVVPVT